MAQRPDLYHWNCFFANLIPPSKNCCRWAGWGKKARWLFLHDAGVPFLSSILFPLSGALALSVPFHLFLATIHATRQVSLFVSGRELEATWKPIKWHRAKQVRFSCRQWHGSSGCTAATRPLRARRRWNMMSSGPLLGIWSGSAAADWR